MALSQNVVRDTISAINKGTDIHAIAEILNVTESTVYYRINANKLIFEAAVERNIIRKPAPIVPTVRNVETSSTQNEPKPTEGLNETIITKNGGKVITNFSSIHADLRLIGSLPDILSLLKTLKIKGV